MSVFYDLSKTPRNILNQAIVRAIVSENNGLLFDPSDLSTLYQDSAGTTPVTAVEQPVGKMLDKSGNNWHATQSITASRPTLSARYNLLTKTENFADAAWGKIETTATPGYADPFSGMTANKIIESATNNGHLVQMQLGICSASVAVFSVALKQAGRGWAIVQLKNSDASADAYAWVNLSTGEVGTKTGNPIIAVSSLSNGWYTVSVSKLLTSSSGWVVAVHPAIGDGVVAYRGDGTSGIYICHPQLEYGPVATRYQRVNTGTDYDTDERYFKKYLRFDGVDDYLNLPYMGLYANGSASVVAGYCLNSKAAQSLLLSEANNTTSTSLYYLHRHLQTSGYVNFFIKNDASVVLCNYSDTNAVEIGVAGVKSSVDTGAKIKQWDNSADFDEVNYARSGVVSLNTTTIGALVYTTTSSYFNGNIYGLIITKSALTDSQRVACERYLGRKSGVQL